MSKENPVCVTQVLISPREVTKKRQYCARREFQLREKIQMSTRGR